MTRNPLIRIVHLTSLLPNSKKGLDEIDLSIDEGEFVVIAGRNGAGKTLLMKHLAMLTEAEEGEIYYHDFLITKKPEKVRGKIGLIFQDADAQLLGETVYEDASIGPKNLRLPKEEVRKRTEKALHWAGLWDKKDTAPYVLSGGEKRRLAIAGMLAMECECLIFDEPFANLDYPSIVQLLQSLVLLKEAGKTVIILTHELEKVLAHADRLVILAEGQIVAEALPEQFADISYGQWGLRSPFAEYRGPEDLTWIR